MSGPSRWKYGMFSDNKPFLLPSGSYSKNRLGIISFGRLLSPLFGNSTLSAFFDTGRLKDLSDESKQLSNAGVGIPEFCTRERNALCLLERF